MIPKGVKYFHMKLLFWGWVVLKWWPPICCEEGKLFYQCLACRKPLSWVWQWCRTDTHKRPKQPGMTVESLSVFCSTDYKNILRNKTCLLGLHLSPGTAVTESPSTLRVWDTRDVPTRPFRRPSLGRCYRWDPLPLKFYVHPKNRLFTCTSTSLLSHHQPFLLLKEGWTSQRKAWMRGTCLLSAGRRWLGHHSWASRTSQKPYSNPK